MHEAPGVHSGCRDCGAFLLDLAGCFSPGQVLLQTVESTRATSTELEDLIEATWREQTARAQAEGKLLFNGQLCRLVRTRVSEHRLELSVGVVSYREFLGTNLTHAHLRYSHGPEVLADPLGLSAAISTCDGFLLLGRRSQYVAYHAGRIHPIGGMLDWQQGRPGDVFDATVQELREELSLEPAAIGGLRCMGIVRDKHIYQPEMIFQAPISLEFAQVRRMLDQVQGVNEHSDLVAVRNHPAAVVGFMEQNFSELTPVAFATLLLHGLSSWGSGWFAAARGYLRSVV